MVLQISTMVGRMGKGEERHPSGRRRIGTSTVMKGALETEAMEVSGPRTRREDALKMYLQHRTAAHPIRGGVTWDTVQATGAATNFGCIFNHILLLYTIEG